MLSVGILTEVSSASTQRSKHCESLNYQGKGHVVQFQTGDFSAQHMVAACLLMDQTRGGLEYKPGRGSCVHLMNKPACLTPASPFKESVRTLDPIPIPTSEGRECGRGRFCGEKNCLECQETWIIVLPLPLNSFVRGTWLA